MNESLDSLAKKHGTDKSSLHHGYCDIYEHWLNSRREKFFTFLEIGIGGYQYPDRGGQGLKMWEEYFTIANIVGIDKYDKTGIKDLKRSQIFKISQDDEEKLKLLVQVMGNPEVIVDDGSHINPLTIKSFEILFPMLKDGGLYIIEDVHTSYWEEIASDGTDFGGGTHPFTVINYFKSMVDFNLNHSDSKGRVLPAKWMKGYEFPIKGITFYKELIIIEKK